VNGGGDDVVDQGDRTNGRAGRNAGTVMDDHRITVNGSRDDVTSSGDSANGGNGRTGRNGGSGGTIDDNRSVVANGNRDQVNFGTNSADGGNGGRGAGNGGAITDNRRVDNNGTNNRVKAGGEPCQWRRRRQRRQWILESLRPWPTRLVPGRHKKAGQGEPATSGKRAVKSEFGSFSNDWIPKAPSPDDPHESSFIGRVPRPLMLVAAYSGYSHIPHSAVVLLTVTDTVYSTGGRHYLFDTLGIPPP
jgi:hypothetical protein